MRKIVRYSVVVCLILSGCVDLSLSLKGIHPTPDIVFGRDEYICAGLVLDGMLHQTVYSEPISPKAPVSIPSEVSALTIHGTMPPLNAERYENIRAMNWEILVPAEDENAPNKGAQEKAVAMLRELSRFPRLKYLTLKFPVAESSMLVAPFYDFPQMDGLEHLEVGGIGLLVMGLTDSNPAMKNLKSLIVRAVGNDWEASEEDHDSAIIVTTLYWLQDAPLEKLNLEGALLLQQETLRYLTRLKRLTPPIYYSLKDVPKSVERLDMSVSELPLDGFDRLPLLPNLRELVIQRGDEKEIRRIMSGRQVNIIINDEDQCRRRNEIIQKGNEREGELAGE